MLIRDPRDFIVDAPVPGTKWILRGRLGEGGMGVVLDVLKEPGIVGAMKVLRPTFAHDREFVRRFFEEVKLLARVRHPNIVSVIDFDVLDDGTPFVVMERLMGHTLRNALRSNSSGLPPRVAYDVARQLLEGLFCAHANTPPIIHRDVKPENIFLHRPKLATPVVKLIDFGIAAVFGTDVDRRTFGTPRYMAPEQISGRAPSPQTDLYMVALVVYEMLTGRFPWDVDTRNVSALIDSHMRSTPIPASKHAPWIPKLVEESLLRALDKSPATRPRDAHEMVAGLYELQYMDDRPRVETGIRSSDSRQTSGFSTTVDDSSDESATLLDATLETVRSIELHPVPLSAASMGCDGRMPPRPRVRPIVHGIGRDSANPIDPDPPRGHSLLPRVMAVATAPTVLTPVCDRQDVEPRSRLERGRWEQSAAVLAMLVPMIGLSLSFSERVRRLAGVGEVSRVIASDLGAGESCADLNRTTARESIRVAHTLPPRTTSSEVAISQLSPAESPRSRARASTREKTLAGASTEALPSPKESETRPSTVVFNGARSSNDGFDELVLPRP